MGMTTPKYYNENIVISIYVHGGRFKRVKLFKSAGVFLNLLIFSKISGLCQLFSKAQNLLEN